MGIILWIVGLVLFISALIDILKRSKPASWKLMWIVICLTFPFFGVLSYFLFAKRDA